MIIEGYDTENFLEEYDVQYSTNVLENETVDILKSDESGSGDLERAKFLFPDSITEKRVGDPEFSTKSRLSFRFPDEESREEITTIQQQTTTETTEAQKIKVKALTRSFSPPYLSAKLNILSFIFIVYLIN